MDSRLVPDWFHEMVACLNLVWPVGDLYCFSNTFNTFRMLVYYYVYLIIIIQPYFHILYFLNYDRVVEDFENKTVKVNRKSTCIKQFCFWRERRRILNLLHVFRHLITSGVQKLLLKTVFRLIPITQSLFRKRWFDNGNLLTCNFIANMVVICFNNNYDFLIAFRWVVILIKHLS